MAERGLPARAHRGACPPGRGGRRGCVAPSDVAFDGRDRGAARYGGNRKAVMREYAARHLEETVKRQTGYVLGGIGVAVVLWILPIPAWFIALFLLAAIALPVVGYAILDPEPEAPAEGHRPQADRLRPLGRGRAAVGGRPEPRSEAARPPGRRGSGVRMVGRRRYGCPGRRMAVGGATTVHSGATASGPCYPPTTYSSR